MPSKKHQPEEVIGKLREAEIVLGQGGTTAEVCRWTAVSEETYYRWPNRASRRFRRETTMSAVWPVLTPGSGNPGAILALLASVGRSRARDRPTPAPASRSTGAPSRMNSKSTPLV